MRDGHLWLTPQGRVAIKLLDWANAFRFVEDNNMRKFVGALTALTLVAAPVAASAGTRAGDVVPAAAKVQRSVSSVDRVNAGGGSAIVVAIVVIVTVIAGIIAATDDEQSDG